MHELTICHSLLREAERIAKQHERKAVTALTIAIGPLSGVEAPLLERAFSIARTNTAAEFATLEIENLPVVVWCEDCALASTVRANALLCVQCGNWKVTLKSGGELLLKSVVLADAANASTPVF